MGETIADAQRERLLMLQNSELDCLIGLEDIVTELEALQHRATALRLALRSVRAELRALEGIAA